MKLFCIPYAGGSATIYYKFKKPMADTAELILMELPGKGMRMDEPFAKSIHDIAVEFCNIIQKEAGSTEYVLLGYSMGGIIAFELYIEIVRRGMRLPSKIIFAACEAPNAFCKDDTAELYRLPDQEFISGVEKFGFIPSELKEDEEILKFFLPSIKADFKLVSDYRLEARNTTILSHVYILYSDYEERNANIHEWDKFCIGKINYCKFEKGAHFFINAEFERMVSLLYEIFKNP